jgi:hypothetical protein
LLKHGEEQDRGYEGDGEGSRDDARAKRQKEESERRKEDEVRGSGVAASGREGTRGEDQGHGETLLLRELPEGQQVKRDPLGAQKVVVTRESREPVGTESEDDAREKGARDSRPHGSGQGIGREGRRREGPEDDEVRPRHLTDEEAQGNELDSLQETQGMEGETDPDGVEDGIGLERAGSELGQRPLGPPVVPEVALRVALRFADVMRPELEDQGIGEKTGEGEIAENEKTSSRGSSSRRRLH